MGVDDDLRARVDVLERFVLKHFSHLYAKVVPADVPSTIDEMRSIFRHPTSPREGARALRPAPDKRLQGILGIYTNPTSPRTEGS